MLVVVSSSGSGSGKGSGGGGGGSSGSGSGGSSSGCGSGCSCGGGCGGDSSSRGRSRRSRRSRRRSSSGSSSSSRRVVVVMGGGHVRGHGNCRAPCKALPTGSRWLAVLRPEAKPSPGQIAHNPVSQAAGRTLVWEASTCRVGCWGGGGGGWCICVYSYKGDVLLTGWGVCFSGLPILSSLV